MRTTSGCYSAFSRKRTRVWAAQCSHAYQTDSCERLDRFRDDLAECLHGSRRRLVSHGNCHCIDHSHIYRMRDRRSCSIQSLAAGRGAERARGDHCRGRQLIVTSDSEAGIVSWSAYRTVILSLPRIHPGCMTGMSFYVTASCGDVRGSECKSINLQPVLK